MRRAASVVLPFGPSEYPFRLRIGELESLQDETQVSPFALFQRLAQSQPMTRDAEHVIRLGLIGGGMGVIDAKNLVRRAMEDQPLALFLPLAGSILSVALFGVEDEEPGKAGAADPAPEVMRASASPPSMAQEP